MDETKYYHPTNSSENFIVFVFLKLGCAIQTVKKEKIWMCNLFLEAYLIMEYKAKVKVN